MNQETVLSSLFLILVALYQIDYVASSCQDKSNTTCTRCVRDFSCYWCAESKYCGDRPTIKPSDKECDGKWYAFSQCSVSGNILLVIIPVVVVVLLGVVGFCIYCCCCRDCLKRRAQRSWAKDDNRRENKKRELQERHATKEEERKIRHDEIRAKYGLFKEEPKYERFDTQE